LPRISQVGAPIYERGALMVAVAIMPSALMPAHFELVVVLYSRQWVAANGMSANV